jgi:hypothetical protein
LWPPSPDTSQPFGRIAVERWPRGTEAIESFTLDLLQDAVCLCQSETAHERLYRIVPALAPGVRQDRNLATNSRRYLGLDPHQLPWYRILVERHDGRRVLRSASHSWALWAWSHWLRSKHLAQPLIVHLDAHDDLGTPCLRSLSCKGRYATLACGHIVDVRQPGTIARGIEERAIGIGSFIVPLLHALEGFNLLHIHRHAASDDGRSATRFHLSGIVLDDRSRPMFRIANDKVGTAPGLYVTTDDLSVLGALRWEGPVLFDVDMDYFCDRFDNKLRSAADDASTLDQVCARIDEVGEWLRRVPELMSHIEVVTLALSPGFFPSDYWSESIARLERAITQALDGSPFAPSL